VSNNTTKPLVRTEQDFYNHAKLVGAQIFTLTMCPFCGGPPVLHVHQTKHGSDGKEFTVDHAHVFCHECGAQSSEIDDYDLDPDDIQGHIDLQIQAMQKWNNRNGSAASAWQNDLSSLYISPEDGHQVRLREFMEGTRT
jgi:hypothetical protein